MTCPTKYLTKIQECDSSCVNFGFLNVRCLFCHLDKVRIFVSCSNLDVFCVVETWLTSKINDQSIALNGFNVLRNDRTHKRGGGVFIYYKKCYKLKLV